MKIIQKYHAAKTDQTRNIKSLKKPKIIFLLVSVITSLIILEIFTSKFLPQKTYQKTFKESNHCFVKSEFAVFELQPDCQMQFTDIDTDKAFTTVTNSLGLRNQEISITKNQKEKRILFLGDSFIFGFGVEDKNLISTKLNELLNSKYDTNYSYQVINSGYAGGFGPDGYYLYFKNKGQLLKPDLIVFSIFVYNDFSDLQNSIWYGTGEFGEPDRIVSRTAYVDDQGYLMSRSLPFIYRIPFLRDSHLCILTNSLLTGLKHKLSYYYDRIRFKIKPPVMPTGEASDTNLPGIYYGQCVFGEICQRQTYRLFSDLYSVISATKNEVEKSITDNKSRFLVLLIPADFQIYPDALDKYINDDGIPKNAPEIIDPQPQKRIKKFLETQKISYIDLLPVFRKDPLKLYFQEDGHWNKSGHQAAAQIIYKWITENNL